MLPYSDVSPVSSPGVYSCVRCNRYRIDLMKDPTRQMLRLRSMYAEQESDCLVFQQKDQKEGGGLELVETPLAMQHMDKVCISYLFQYSILSYVCVCVLPVCDKEKVVFVVVVVCFWN